MKHRPPSWPTAMRFLANIISSQHGIHAAYGGVVPELACRSHIENIRPVVHAALEQAGATLRDIDLIGVTQGPGLVGGTACRSEFCEVPRLRVAQAHGRCSPPRWTRQRPFSREPDGAVSLCCLGGLGGTFGPSTFAGRGDATRYWEEHVTTPRVSASTRWPRCSAWAIRGVRSLTAWLDKAIPMPFIFLAPCSGRDNLDFSFSGVKAAVRSSSSGDQRRGRRTVVRG